MDVKETGTAPSAIATEGPAQVSYLNSYCWCGRIRDFLRTTPENWLSKMKAAHKKSSPFPLSPQNIRAWENSCTVLRDSLLSLGKPFDSLHIVFEYCLPKYPPRNGKLSEHFIWADAVIVSSDTAVVLEFKDRTDAIIEHARQARMYRNRLQRYHDQSFGMRKWAVLVPTLSHDLNETRASRVTACSPDQLPTILQEQFGTYPNPHDAIAEWINSSYSVHRCAQVIKKNK